MPRIPYVPSDLAEPREIVEAIRARRGGTLLNLDRMLLHSPQIAMGWNSMLGAIRTRATVPWMLRELVMCTVAALNEAVYEWTQHAPLFLQAGGTEAQLSALRDPVAALVAPLDLFDAAQRATLALSIEMTRGVRVSDPTMAAVRAALGDDRQVFELVATVAAYNMVSRILVALEVEPE